MLDSLTQLQTRDLLVDDISSINIGNLLLIDIDNFNSINNIYGIKSGDIVLKQLAKFLSDFSKEKRYQIYRVSSNEFALLDSEATHDIDDIYDDIEYLIDAVSKYDIYIDAIEESINIHVTIGFATSNNMILEQAGAALKYAKKNSLKFSAYSNVTDSRQDLSRYAYWNKEIQKAIESENIIPFFQPIFNKDGDIAKYEILMRLVQEGEEKKLFISPVEFLAISVQTKKYIELSRMIIFHSLHLMENTQYCFSINFSYQDIKSKELMYDLYNYFENNPDVASRVTCEILESELVKDTTVLLQFLKKLKSYGVQIAIDDFGSGFSNFEMILLAEPDLIKIDGSLIKNIDADKKSLTLVEAIVAFSHKMGMKVIAEYVHNKAVYDILRQIEVDMFQGYYLCEPLLTPN